MVLKKAYGEYSIQQCSVAINKGRETMSYGGNLDLRPTSFRDKQYLSMIYPDFLLNK